MTAKVKQLEIEPDAWARFERAVDAAAKSGPKHRVKAKKSPKARKAKMKKPGQ